jgi:hypothetical protein
MMKPCTHCGALFIPKFPNAKLCFDCWRAREDAFERVADLEWDNDRLRAALDATQPAIPGEMRRLLVLLCHPDKHNGSQAATKATTWLLSLPKDGAHG